MICALLRPFSPMNSAHVYGLAAALSLTSAVAQQAPLPSGEQTDGNYRKVILDADRQIDGVWKDTLVDPMELAVAGDGRVFYAQRNGVIKMWTPATRQTVEIARIPVFAGLEDGMLGLTLDPNFLQNGWI